ncbi:MAG: 50S ribosomal protein L15 [Sphingobacteriaceae bacterium]|nr:50S ribosomal protein L15 [Sphingobacteriaceae bacterium]MBK7311517.1 50S ribosomal protein L15 [Sphingobacteriaceae bacterium]
MSKLNSLRPSKGSVKNNFRRGRGQGSGGGGTATRGHKGAQSRSGHSTKRGFEGGQMPLQRRLPKFGFKNINRVEYRGINLSAIQQLADKLKATEITNELLIKSGLASKNDRIKILGKGELKSKLDIKVHAFTATAKKAIEDKGGVATQVK